MLAATHGTPSAYVDYYGRHDTGRYAPGTGPAQLLAGERVVVVGTGLLTVRVCAFDVPPPGAGFVTVVGNVPAEAISAALIEAVTWVELTNVVVRAEPLKLTTEFETKFVPFTVSVNAATPAVTLVGEMLVVVGP